MNKNQEVKREEPYAELEGQFILRLPTEPAKILREAIQSGANNLKDRLTIKLDTDMRHGEVRVDHWLMHAKLLDLPTIIESMKTIDGKSFYKTADICQIMICKEEDDQTTTDEESPAKKKKDPNKVDKKFLWPHGITPPLKNVRKRRFRKTLKKKYAEAPEIEKEVKRLLRVDNDAVHVKFEIINEDEEKIKLGGIKEENGGVGGDVSLEASNQHSVDVAEHDIFGEAVSDSEEEETNINIMEMEDENSRLSADDSMHTDTMSLQGAHSAEKHHPLVTQFTREMFHGRVRGSPDRDGDHDFDNSHERERSRDITREEFDRGISREDMHNVKHERMDDYAVDSIQEMYHVPKQESDYFIFDMPSSSGDYSGEGSSTNASILYAQRRARKEQLEAELPVIRMRCQQQEAEISRIENQALQQRFGEILDNLLTELYEKEREYEELCKITE